MASPNNTKLLFLNLYVYGSFTLFSMFFIPALAIVVAFSTICISHRSKMKLFRRAIRLYGRIVTLLPYPFIKLRYEDRSNGRDPREPYIFVCNHRAASDAFLMCVLPHEVIQVVNVWPFRIPVIGFLAKLAGYLNINSMSPEQFTEKTSKLFREGVSIIFFPEGTRSGGRKMGNFHGSAFRLALRAKIPIVPICISGSENITRKGSYLLRAGMIRVCRLPAITWDDYKDRSVFSLKNWVREIISSELSLMEGRRDAKLS